MTADDGDFGVLLGLAEIPTAGDCGSCLQGLREGPGQVCILSRYLRAATTELEGKTPPPPPSKEARKAGSK